MTRDAGPNTSGVANKLNNTTNVQQYETNQSHFLAVEIPKASKFYFRGKKKTNQR
jgi:hypothetical protein